MKSTTSIFIKGRALALILILLGHEGVSKRIRVRRSTMETTSAAVSKEVGDAEMRKEETMMMAASKDVGEEDVRKDEQVTMAVSNKVGKIRF